MESTEVVPPASSSPPLSPVSTLSAVSDDTDPGKGGGPGAPADFKADDVIESDSEWEGMNEEDPPSSSKKNGFSSHSTPPKSEPGTSHPPAPSTSDGGSSPDKFLVLEEISSSEDTADFEEEEEEATTKPSTAPGKEGDDLLAQNEQDLLHLVQALETNPSDKRICFFCFRVGHITVTCADKHNKERRSRPHWRQGVLQRRYMFYDMNPAVKKKHSERKLQKHKLYAQKRVLRQDQQEADRLRNEREKLKTVQELLEMAQALLD